MFRRVLHAFLKVLGLADDIIGDDDVEEGYAN